MATFEGARRELEDPHRVLGFLDYIERVWIGKKRDEIVQKAKFPVELWNHHSTLLSADSTTNNAVEGFNASWTNYLPSNPSLFIVFQAFKEVRAQSACSSDSKSRNT